MDWTGLSEQDVNEIAQMLELRRDLTALLDEVIQRKDNSFLVTSISLDNLTIILNRNNTPSCATS